MEYFIHIKNPCQCTEKDSHETDTVRRRTKTIVTPKMAMESFRLSFLNDDQDVNFDAILGELYELESQLNNTQTELSRAMCSPSGNPSPQVTTENVDSREHSDIHVMSEQEELDQLAAEITRNLHYHKTSSIHQQQQQHHHHHHHQHHHLTVAGARESLCDSLETDSAFSDNGSLPSSESFTSMATVSSSNETTSSSSGDTCSMSSTMYGAISIEDEQVARIKAEKICKALEKIKEAKIRKLFVRAFAKDGSSKSILVDEKMNIAQVCSQLANKNHIRLNHKLSVVEFMPELHIERILEDHDSLVENMVMWTKDSKNKIIFEEKMDKYDLFRNPEKYLLYPVGVKQGPLTPQQKDRLIQQHFDSDSIPGVEGALYLKTDGKKTWKKFNFILKANGLYYNPRGKASKSPKDMICLVQFEYVEVYRGIEWKKKYHAPTDYCFALKHPQIQKKTSKYIWYFCAETDLSLDQWVMGIRIAKIGKQMLHNYERVTHEISTWDLRQTEIGAIAADDSLCQRLNHSDLRDSLMSVPEPDGRHSVIQVLNQSLVCNSTASNTARIIVNNEAHKSFSESGSGSDGRSMTGSAGSSSISSGGSESSHKALVKHVSFSESHCVISEDSGNHIGSHRDSMTSALSDSSDDSKTFGEIRHGSSFRSKMRPRLPVTTDTTRQLADMCNVHIDEGEDDIYSEAFHRGPQTGFSRCDRKRLSMPERCATRLSETPETTQRSTYLRSSLSSNLKQHSLDSGACVSTIYKKQSSPDKESYYQHVRRKSEPLGEPVLTEAEVKPSASTQLPVYTSLTEGQKIPRETGLMFSYTHPNHKQENSQPTYNRIRSPIPSLPSQASKDKLGSTNVLSSTQYRESKHNTTHISHSPLTHESSTSLIQPMSVYARSINVSSPPPQLSSGFPTPGTETVIKKQSINSHHLKESPYNTAASFTQSSPSKSSPPPTLPKPQNNPFTYISSQPGEFSKHSQPTLPQRSGIESSCSISSKFSYPTNLSSTVPKHILPKSSHPTQAASNITSSYMRSSSPSPTLLKQISQTNLLMARPGNGHRSRSEIEMPGFIPQSSSLRLSENSARARLESGVDDSSLAMKNRQLLVLFQQHRRSKSAGGVAGKKTPPPPPPKRSENTKLSTDFIQKQNSNVNIFKLKQSLTDPRETLSSNTESGKEQSGKCISVPKSTSCEKFDGIMNIDELPLPPDDLLVGLPALQSEERRSRPAKKSIPPPVPPKRSKETHLSSH